MGSVQYSMSTVSMLSGDVLPQNFLPQPAKSVKYFIKVSWGNNNFKHWEAPSISFNHDRLVTLFCPQCSAPDMYSHRPPHYLEPLYEPIQSVQRTLMLLDIARAVHPETLINRVAYDQVRKQGQFFYLLNLWTNNFEICWAYFSFPGWIDKNRRWSARIQ